MGSQEQRRSFFPSLAEFLEIGRKNTVDYEGGWVAKRYPDGTGIMYHPDGSQIAHRMSREETARHFPDKIMRKSGNS